MLKESTRALDSCKDQADDPQINARKFRDLLDEVIDALDEILPVAEAIHERMLNLTGVAPARNDIRIYMREIDQARLNLRIWIGNVTTNYESGGLPKFMRERPYRNQARTSGTRQNPARPSSNAAIDFIYHLFELLRDYAAALHELGKAMDAGARRNVGIIGFE